MDKAESLPYDSGISEKFFYLCGDGIGDEVEIFGLFPLHKIADSSADDIGLMAGAFQTFDYPDGFYVDHGLSGCRARVPYTPTLVRQACLYCLCGIG